MLDLRRYFLTTPSVKYARFGLFPFRSPLLGEYSPQTSKICGAFFLFLRLLRCFTSAGSPAPRETVRSTAFAVLGFPIRKSPDQRLLATSPRLIAGTPRPSSPSGPEASTTSPSAIPRQTRNFPEKLFCSLLTCQRTFFSVFLAFLK